ncbi:DNA mismatch repair endonuclease MutL [Oceanobacillus profundus]|uniref:DNA mismatch repair protein MutL n=1 Tax=Oceanobacillus profundus TaxID=372463 RepID=A0A417YJT3_9BACI|nr:DNA mismatch repair endonuclease MutL [Oceanobacillus profundus]MCM3396431.1 DNA mismatch repair endonuclease MutL [Oceanobacillus profundus]MDO6451156.1 DNA mismatch repair endonuclease MutL [Oceanobacillus profundus]PAE29956.1 DNA mismatch repair endonuclease MutL [Paenibacillus sp. 7884-2]RHW33565.1 DNA mismatch repair endonuclease MutL [Oceanobacillus profundus]
MPIIQMSESLANKIAAGEVVERPASVVKELVENSIDANSTWIKVDIVEAGLQQIKITDNGDGMSEQDATKAFLRHATSKIKNETDLFHVKTLGFRGEALASIASVSKLIVKTSQGDSASTFLALEGGKVLEKKKSDARKGTEIIVENLFFNTPARLKYMKSLHTELGHITDLLNRLALSHPEIRFEATHNGKGLFKTAGTGDVLQVISQIYGMNIAKKMLPIKHETLDFSIGGYIAKPEVTRASRAYISTIINGRYIRSVALNQAIIRAYHTLLPIGRSPIVVLSIKMDPILVDVNVHPTKLEVRFSKDRELFTAIEETIKQKFREITLIPEMERKVTPKEKSVQHTMNFDSPVVERERENGGLQSKEQLVKYNPPVNEVREPDASSVEYEEKYTATKDEADTEESFPAASYIETPVVEQQPIEVDQQRVPTMYPIGQLQGTYILAQNENGLYMIDQHAAQERIKYEFFKEKLGKPMNESQELLLPMTFEFSKREAIFIEQYKESFEKVGLFFEAFGNQTYVIRSHPNWFPIGFEEEVIREMVEQIMNEEKVNVELIREEAAILMSCKRSIKANHYLKQEEMFRLLEDLRTTTDPFTCPHGRPIIVHFSTYELEKMFKRVM